MLSLDAFQVSATDEPPGAVATSPVGVDGGVVSEEVAEPWQAVVPVSVKVLPTSGMNRQS